MNELVYSNVPGPTKCYWIGISDIEHEDKYVYASDDKPILWTNFRQKYNKEKYRRKIHLLAFQAGLPGVEQQSELSAVLLRPVLPIQGETGPGSRDPADYCGFYEFYDQP